MLYKTRIFTPVVANFALIQNNSVSPRRKFDEIMLLLSHPNYYQSEFDSIDIVSDYMEKINEITVIEAIIIVLPPLS